jgi:hypothetical protein
VGTQTSGSKAINWFRQLSTPVKIILFTVGAFLSSTFLCCGCLTVLIGSGNSPAANSSNFSNKKAQLVHVSAVELYREYKANEVAADQDFKGQTLSVSGNVDKIGKDILGTIYVTFDNGGKFEIGQVQCMFDDKHAARAAKLSKGQRVTVIGTCEGKMGNVLLRKCEFVD